MSRGKPADAPDDSDVALTVDRVEPHLRVHRGPQLADLGNGRVVAYETNSGGKGEGVITG